MSKVALQVDLTVSDVSLLEKKRKITHLIRSALEADL